MQYLSVHVYAHSEWLRNPGEFSNRKIILYRKPLYYFFFPEEKPLSMFCMECKKETSGMQIKDEFAATEYRRGLFSHEKETYLAIYW